jgi:hypothetical protein
MRQKVIASLIAISGAATASGCGTRAEYLVQGTERSIGVDGLITITPHQEDVNLVQVELINLPPPERHDRMKRAFVVWLTPQDGAPIRAGRLAYDRESRRGVLQAMTPNDALFVQITAEDASDVTKPSDFVVVSRHVVLKRENTAAN